MGGMRGQAPLIDLTQFPATPNYNEYMESNIIMLWVRVCPSIATATKMSLAAVGPSSSHWVWA